MHSHNNSKDSGHKGMLWMMIPCFLLLGFIFLGGEKLSSGGYFWPILIGVFFVAHVWMMFKGHGGHGDAGTKDKTNDPSAQQPETKGGENKHKHDSCCH